MGAQLTTVSDRLQIVESAHAAATSSFADDVRAGLGSVRKRLSPKYFYDDLGSALFDAITLLPEYYLTRAETEILNEWGWEIVRELEAPLEFLELGSGSAIKTRLLIEEALRVQGTLRYSPIDIALEALRGSSITLVDAYPDLRIRAYAGDYFTVLGSCELRFEHTALAMFMGSNIGNYRPDEARELLRLIAAVLRPGDGLLLGVDLKKDRTILELAYDDPTGVTAAFNRNILGRINRDLGGHFALNEFAHIVAYDDVRGCVDSFLQAERAQNVAIDALGITVGFEAGERIHTESSYKFDDVTLAALAAACGFRPTKQWQDSANRFAIQLFARE
ncbi:MAG: L-histidine N(alpha)-methyltransferase [Vulcanimicrobiaceae bacterium]